MTIEHLATSSLLPYARHAKKQAAANCGEVQATMQALEAEELSE